MAIASRTARIEAPARLHLGFLDPSACRGRSFGSIGLALDNIATVVNAAPYAELEVRGVACERARQHALAVIAQYGLHSGLRIDIEQAIPAHVGLGSGTQLALAVASAVLAASGRSVRAAELATLLGRGKRSGIGLSLFEQGGLVVDGGHGIHTSSPPLITRLAFPAGWRVILISDHSDEGLSGRAESAAFGALPPLPQALAAKICHATLMGLLPAVVEQDFEAFSHAIAEVQAIVGDHFAAVQSAGRFTSVRVRHAVEHVQRACGLVGVGQSSWGPTAFVFAVSDTLAQGVVAELRARFSAEEGLTFTVCAARNHGAGISCGGQPAQARVAIA